jgi:hypothetical protein
MKTTWAVWAKGGTWLSTLIMSFVIPPPTDISNAQAVNATIHLEPKRSTGPYCRL